MIASRAGHMLPPLPAEQNEALARTPAGELAQLPFLQRDIVTNSGAAYALAKRANILRVQAASVEWGDRGARLNSLSPGIIMTPLAMDEQVVVRLAGVGHCGRSAHIGPKFGALTPFAPGDLRSAMGCALMGAWTCARPPQFRPPHASNGLR